ncbi:helix-turn-helix transcriptional regulator [Streptomyces sp. NPDC047042]|uniref:helix-turn-helix transcriptional regulator n=1 Tax=Streptomyces sp. NPDC047042 TaxID=3154807 RepID=UPI00340EB6F0
MGTTGGARDTDGSAGTDGTGLPDPGTARTSAEFVALLRRLKDHSGLTYRQLEERAAARGDVLARSTVADMLRRDGLPRAELVSALVRTCGAERAEATWLASRQRIAASGTSGTASGTPPGPTGAADVSSSGSGADSSRVRTASLALLGTVVLLVVGGLLLLQRDDEPSGGGSADGRTPVTAGSAENGQTPVARQGPAPGLSRIRPVGAPGLCLTEGQARADSGESKVVAAQWPCGKAVPPTTTLLKTDDGLYRIQWDKPGMGKGCLTVLGEEEGYFRTMLEPWDDCAAPGTVQLFRIERAEGTGNTDGAGAWRLRSAGDGERCVGIRGNTKASGAVAVVEPCVDAQTAEDIAVAGQHFLIDRDRADPH